MTDTTTRPDWLYRLVDLMNGAKKTDISPHDIITGAQWRDFYLNHWPKEFYIDDFRVDFEDERGEYVLSDEARHPFEAFGIAVWQDDENFRPLAKGVKVDVSLLYAAILEENREEIVSFRIASEKRNMLITAAEAVGARTL